MLAIGTVSCERTRLSVFARSHAVSSASTGNLGTMYDGNFEPDALKNTNTKTAHTYAKRCQEKPFAAGVPSRHILKVPHVRSGSHGSAPSRKSGTKYHHDCER